MTQMQRTIAITAGVPGAVGLRWSNPLAISFEVEMTNGKRANKAQVTMINLSPEGIGAIEEKGAVVTIEAGYGDFLGVVFVGNVTRGGVQTIWSGNDKTTTISLAHKSEAHTARKTASYAAQVESKTIIREMAESMGVGVGNLSDIPATTYATGFVALGNASDTMTALCDDLGVGWSIQEGQLLFLSGEVLIEGDGVLLSPSSGLLGSPTQVKGGVEAVALMNLSLKIGHKIRIESRDVVGFYKLQKVAHSGSNRGGDFTSAIKAKAV